MHTLEAFTMGWSLYVASKTFLRLCLVNIWINIHKIHMCSLFEINIYISPCSHYLTYLCLKSHLLHFWCCVLSFVVYSSSQSVASMASMTRFSCSNTTHLPTTSFSWLKTPATFRREIWWRWCSRVSSSSPLLSFSLFFSPLHFM